MRSRNSVWDVGWRYALLAIAACSVAACGPSREERADAAEDRAADNARDDLQGQTYSDSIGTGECTQDCSGHDAGFAYAQEHEIENPDDCSGNSESFVEGCKAYGEEITRRAEEAREAVMAGKDPDADE